MGGSGIVLLELGTCEEDMADGKGAVAGGAFRFRFYRAAVLKLIWLRHPFAKNFFLRHPFMRRQERIRKMPFEHLNVTNDILVNLWSTGFPPFLTEKKITGPF